MNSLVYFIASTLALFGTICETSNLYSETFLARRDFLDRSDLIEKFLNFSSPKIPYFTAPPYFGKTTILRMIQRFFDIETDSLHNPLPILDTEAYWIFKDLKIGAGYGANETHEHLARHPVINMNFSQPFEKLFEGSVADNVLYYMNRVVGAVFDEFKWLIIYSMQITNRLFKYREHEAEFIEMANNRRLTRMDILASLDMLASLLYKYFQGSQVVILIDDLDKPLREALVSPDDLSEEIKILYQLIYDMLAQATRPDSPYVFKILLTGTSSVVLSKPAKNMTRVNTYEFLEDHYFNAFSGFFESNLKELFDWYKCDETEITSIRTYYKAYSTRQNQTQIYNSYSIMKYFGAKERYNSTELKNYWIPGEVGQFVYKFLNSYEFLETFSKLSFNRSIRVQLPDVDDSVTFELLVMGMESHFNADEFPFSEILVYYCLEHGYLTYTSQKDMLRVPSPEVRQVVETNLINYFNLTGIDLMGIGQWFDNLLNNTSEDVKTFEEKFQTILKSQFIKINGSNNENFTQEYTFLSIINSATKMTAFPGDLVKYGVDSSQQPVLIYKFQDSIIIVVLRDRKRKFSIETLDQAAQRAIKKRNSKVAISLGINVDRDRSVKVQIVIKNTRG